MPDKPRRRPFLWLLDLFLVLVLCGAAFPVRWSQTHGDFWFDEADYARAAARGFEANRWDLSEVPDEPEKLVRLRHYHPPLVAQVLGVALTYGSQERTLRLPFVLAGSLTVGLLYLCGLALFRSRPDPGGGTAPLRGPALAAAVILIFTPAHIRASSHAIPWAIITFWLVAVLTILARHALRPHALWLVLLGAVLGGLAVTSEYLFPTLVITGVCLALLAVRDLAARRPGWLWQNAAGLFGGALLFAVVCSIFWPAAATGGAMKMFQHYVEMADTNAFPVAIEGVSYQRAPKWAYLYWYWTEFPAYFIFYAAGLAAVLVQLARRRLEMGQALLLVFALLIVAVAHRAHIIGPEYLAHALPFLTLLGAAPLAVVARTRPVHSLPALAACCWVVVSAPEVAPLSGMDARSRISRWPAAAQFLAQRWRKGDRIIASQYAASARWYVLHTAASPAQEDDIRMLPADNARNDVLDDLLKGRFRWVVVGNSFTDWTDVDNKIRMLIGRWPVVYRSDEAGTGPSRLLIYECPRGASPKHPLRPPWPLTPPENRSDGWLPE